MRSWKHRLVFILASGVACGSGSNGTPLAAQEPPAGALPALPRTFADQRDVLHGPILSVGEAIPRLPSEELTAADRPLPINLATALQLAGARPTIIAVAQASVGVAQAQLSKANVLWLPSLNVGAGYYRHDGATQGQSGNFYDNSKDQFFAGAGLTARVAATDALFAPLAARQVVRSRMSDVQAARNDALLAVAEAYFDVQQARGRLAASRDVLEKGLKLEPVLIAQVQGSGQSTDLHRGRAVRASFEDRIATTREQWGVASANLTQVLRLDPTATVVPLEPPNLSVTLVSPQVSVDDLIPIGLTARPELASQQALVQAALARIKQERMRPLLPSLVLEGAPGPAGPGGLMGGVFGSTINGAENPTLARDDVSVGLVWELQNLGLGNRALVRQRRSEHEQQVIELFRTQDQVAAEIARAHVQLRSSTARVASAENGLGEARLAYEGSVAELGKVEHLGGVEIVVRRAFEVVAALRSWSEAYDTYFQSVNDYNRAQFRLFRSLGYPAAILAYERAPEPMVPVDTTRPPQMAPVCAPDPCPYRQ